MIFKSKAFRKGYEKGYWDAFADITAAYFGKGYYLEQDDGRVYSRLTEHYLLTKNLAYKEFLDHILEAEE